MVLFFTVMKNIARAELGYSIVNDQQIQFCLHEQSCHMAIIQVYAQTSDAEE